MSHRAHDSELLPGKAYRPRAPVEVEGHELQQKSWKNVEENHQIFLTKPGDDLIYVAGSMRHAYKESFLVPQSQIISLQNHFSLKSCPAEVAPGGHVYDLRSARINQRAKHLERTATRHGTVLQVSTAFDDFVQRWILLEAVQGLRWWEVMIGSQSTVEVTSEGRRGITIWFGESSLQLKWFASVEAMSFCCFLTSIELIQHLCW